MSDSVWPHRRQTTRLLRPWDSPGKNTGVGCHFLLQCMKLKSESEVARLCPTPSDSMDRSPPGSSIHGILQARVLEWGAIALSESELSLQLLISPHLPNSVLLPQSLPIYISISQWCWQLKMPSPERGPCKLEKHCLHTLFQEGSEKFSLP